MLRYSKKNGIPISGKGFFVASTSVQYCQLPPLVSVLFKVKCWSKLSSSRWLIFKLHSNCSIMCVSVCVGGWVVCLLRMRTFFTIFLGWYFPFWQISFTFFALLHKIACCCFDWKWKLFQKKVFHEIVTQHPSVHVLDTRPSLIR